MVKSCIDILVILIKRLQKSCGRKPRSPDARGTSIAVMPYFILLGGGGGQQQSGGNGQQPKHKGPKHPDLPKGQWNGCSMHFRFGKNAYFCAEPASCPWKDFWVPKSNN